MSIATDVEIPRDRWGRPLIVPPEGGSPVPYTRATSLAGVLDDTYNLEKWKLRMNALGLVERPDLLLAVAGARDSKYKLDKICEAAITAGKGDSGATIGTALHSLTERIDQGLPLGAIPDAFKPDIEAYKLATAELEHILFEQFVVVDYLKVGGTLDRLVEFRGERYICDIKTGDVKFSALKIAMQMALYSTGVPYDPAWGGRGKPLQVNRHKGLLVHLPQGTGQCDLYFVDLDVGHAAVVVACLVRSMRKRKVEMSLVGEQ